MINHNYVFFHLIGDNIPEFDDIESEDHDECNSGYDDCGVDSDDSTEEIDNEESDSLLSTVLIIFIRIMHHFNFSNKGASAILAFISFLLGMMIYLYHCMHQF